MDDSKSQLVKRNIPRLIAQAAFAILTNAIVWKLLALEVYVLTGATLGIVSLILIYSTLGFAQNAESAPDALWHLMAVGVCAIVALSGRPGLSGSRGCKSTGAQRLRRRLRYRLAPRSPASPVCRASKMRSRTKILMSPEAMPAPMKACFAGTPTTIMAGAIMMVRASVQPASLIPLPLSFSKTLAAVR